ncbi:MAG: hypothetical protein QOH06_5589 [Acidobacteriota bacterium]|jgi:hypothetical protein|nr:hypothetical protein [Acidobacteriota bacterium]
MRNTIEFFARSSRRALLGALTVLAAVSAALPAGADPTLVYSTYLGGSFNDSGFAVAVQGGSTFVAGTTNSPDYPVVAVSSSKWGDEEVAQIFVTALGPSGTPFYSTYVPITNDNGPRVMQGLGIGVGPDGSAYVVAATYEFGSEPVSIHVAKLEPGGALAWHHGGMSEGTDYPRGMTVDSQGNVYVTGVSSSEDPYSGDNVNTVFVWKIRADGSTSYWSNFDVDDYNTAGRGIAVDAAGNAYVLGTDSSTVTKLDPAGSVRWSTYLGPGDGKEIRVAADGSLVVVGTTSSTQFPTLNAIQTELRGPRDLFLARLKPWGSRISSTYLGGSGAEEVVDLALEASSILLAVSSPGADSPLRAALDPSCGNVNFVAKLDAAASRVLDGACLGGSNIFGMAADSSGVSLTGLAAADLPLVNAWQPSPAGGNYEAFATKLVLNNPPDCSAATASPATLWPADGKFVSVLIRGITDPEGGRVTIAMTSIFQDEGLTSPGTPDATGLGTSTARLRATRLNGGNGRVYHVSFTATDPQGGACTGTVKVCVPPVQGGTCGDGGARVDSTRAN